MTTTSPAVSEREEAALYLLDQSISYLYPAALRAAAIIGVADHLADGPKTPKELAQAADADELKLYRIVRLLASRGVFRENEDGEIELTPAADLLRTDVPLSLRAAVAMLTDETFWRGSLELAQNARGEHAFAKIFGMSFFEYWAQETAPVEDFHVGMSSMSEAENQFLARSYDFPKGATVVDIAGGFGALLLLVLRHNPTVRGVLFDHEHVVARHRLGELGDDDRWDVVSGDFFQSCPPGDIYMLKYIAHNWGDEDVVRILGNCQRAMAPGGRVLVMDPVVPPGNTEHFSKLMDIMEMTVYPGGRERTEEEWRRLLPGAGLRLNRILDTGSYISIVEAVAL